MKKMGKHVIGARGDGEAPTHMATSRLCDECGWFSRQSTEFHTAETSQKFE